jgi:regulator of protease activity HflC (stomatin/prohibitin superfamily)
MISAIVILLGLSLAALLFFKSQKQITKRIPIPVGIVVLTLVIASIQPFAIERIDAGCVGIKFKMFGSEQGIGDYEYKAGWVFYNSWTSKVIEIPLYQQHVEYENQTSVAKGGQTIQLKPSYNYSVIPTTAGDMFVNLRKPLPDIEKGWLMTAIMSSINDELNRWSPDSVFSNREVFENAIVNECNKRVGKWFQVSQLRTNMIPPALLQESIAKTTRAKQDIVVAQSQTLVAEADAQRKIAVARGDSAQAVIAAAGRAEAIRREQLNLTPMYLDYIRASNWNGVLPTTVLGSQQVMIPLR